MNTNTNNNNNTLASKELQNFSRKQDSSLQDREHTMYMLMIITSVCIILVNFIFYFFVKFDDNNTYIASILFTLIFPFLINIYGVFYHIHFQETKTEAENLEELERENKTETESKIPVILFGLGLFVTRLNKNVMLLIFPYLMVALFFGTVLIDFSNTLIFDHYDLHRMTIVGESQFMMSTLSYGFLIMSLYLTSKFYLTPKYVK
jgi:hypothetical protein